MLQKKRMKLDQFGQGSRILDYCGREGIGSPPYPSPLTTRRIKMEKLSIKRKIAFTVVILCFIFLMVAVIYGISQGIIPFRQ
jgi:hypothetical protein